MARKPVVTDHAVVRYLEKVMGLDVDEVRERIAREATGAVRFGAVAARVEGITYVLEDGHVITVIRNRNRLSRPIRKFTPLGGVKR